jgi:hypothetical protein
MVPPARSEPACAERHLRWRIAGVDLLLLRFLSGKSAGFYAPPDASENSPALSGSEKSVVRPAESDRHRNPDAGMAESKSIAQR